MSAVEKLLAVTKAELGYLEKTTNSQLDSKTANAGYNNYTKYARDLFPSLQGQAWCDMFVSWCFVQAFGSASAKQLLCGGLSSAYTPTSAQYFKNKKQYYTTPKAGDQIFFKNSTRICHTGIVTKVTSTTVYTIEGNTSSGTAVIANGGGVYEKSYSLSNSNIDGYGRPDWSIVEQLESYEITVSSAGLNVMVAFLNVRNYPKTGAIVGGYEQGDVIKPTHKCFVDGDAWFKTDKGWISGKYLEGWIQELSDVDQRWWYVKSGYTYSISEWVEYNGAWYYIDKDGWMATNVYVESADKNVYYWLNGDGVWESEWDTATPDLGKYKLVI